MMTQYRVGKIFVIETFSKKKSHFLTAFEKKIFHFPHFFQILEESFINRNYSCLAKNYKEFERNLRNKKIFFSKAVKKWGIFNDDIS